MSRKQQIGLTAFLLCQLILWLTIIPQAIHSAQVTIEPGSTVTYGGVARLPDTGSWRFLRDGSHVTAGYTDIKCDSAGVLWLYYEPLKNVASVWVSPDETLSRRGILAGASVNVAYTKVLFTRITSEGPQRIGCGNPVLRGDSANIWVGVIGQPIQPIS